MCVTAISRSVFASCAVSASEESKKNEGNLIAMSVTTIPWSTSIIMPASPEKTWTYASNTSLATYPSFNLCKHSKIIKTTAEASCGRETVILLTLLKFLSIFRTLCRFASQLQRLTPPETQSAPTRDCRAEPAMPYHHIRQKHIRQEHMMNYLTKSSIDLVIFRFICQYPMGRHDSLIVEIIWRFCHMSLHRTCPSGRYDSVPDEIVCLFHHIFFFVSMSHSNVNVVEMSLQSGIRCTAMLHYFG